MASKVVLVAALFEQLRLFTDELIKMYPNDPDFPLFSSSIKLLKMTNPSLVVKNIYNNTNQFSEKIMNKDERFFLEYSFSEYENEVEDINVFSKLKKYIESMSPASKESVWKYIQNIYKLANAINGN
jgi:hypothetical protein